MDAGDRDRIELARERLRAAILFRHWRDVELALEALEEVAGGPEAVTAFAAAGGRCEFCPVDGGGCCVCGGGRN